VRIFPNAPQIALRIANTENLVPPCSSTLTFVKERHNALMSNGGVK